VGLTPYLVDKSVLARLHLDPVAQVVTPLLAQGLGATCDVVELEIGFGARSASELAAVRTQRAALYVHLPMPDEVWARALHVHEALAARGYHRAAGVPDLLIAATAERAGAVVLHYDRDFDLIAEVTGQHVQWVVPPGAAGSARARGVQT